VSAARLRRAEQRIAALRPYADALRRMTRQAAKDAGAEASRLPLLAAREQENSVGLLLVTADRGLAGAFNSADPSRRPAARRRPRGRAQQIVWFASGRRGVSSLTFRGHAPEGPTPASPTARPTAMLAGSQTT